MIESFEVSGVTVCHAWGMTEMSPIGTQGLLSSQDEELLSKDEKLAMKALQGRRAFGVDLKIVDADGNVYRTTVKLSGNYTRKWKYSY